MAQKATGRTETEEFYNCSTVTLYLSAVESTLVPKQPDDWKSSYTYDIGDGMFRAPDIPIMSIDVDIVGSPEHTVKSVSTVDCHTTEIVYRNVDLIVTYTDTQIDSIEIVAV